MAVAPLDVIRVVVKMTQAAQQLRNVYDFIHTGVNAVNDEDVLDAVLAVMETAYGYVVSQVTDNLSFDSVEVVNVTQDALIGEDVFTTTTAGTATDQASPMQVAYLVRFPTNYRGSQGRKFIPGCNEGSLGENGELNTATQAACLAYALEILDGVTVSGELFVPGVDNPDKGRFAAYESAICNDIVGTQRRRKQGQGI